MSKIMKNRILNYAVLGIFALLILGLAGAIFLTPIKAHAYERAGYYQPYSNQFANPYHDPLDNTLTGNPSSYSPAPAPTPASSGTVLGASTKKTSTKTTTTKTTTVTPDYKAEVSDLTANALFSDSGFLPHSILQWILVAILILIIILIGRKLFGLDEKYHSTHLKHS
jgi:hypothetical protein